MTIPNSQILSNSRVQAELLLVETGTRYVRSDDVSDSGDDVSTWTIQASPTLPCLVYVASTSKVADERRTSGDKETWIADHTIRFAHDADIEQGDKLVVSGKTFEIVAVSDNNSNSLLLMAAANRIE